MTANNIPVPDPITPMKSAIIERAPIQIPPKAAATGISLLSYFLVPYSVNPLYVSYLSFNYLATSLTPDPETSIQVLLNNPQVANIKII